MQTKSNLSQNLQIMIALLIYLFYINHLKFMASVDSGLQKPKKSKMSEKLKSIKAKLDPQYFDLALYRIDNELITDHVNDVNFILQNTEEIDWNVPIPFDREEMWQETLQKTKLKGQPYSKVIDTSIMAMARQKYSDFTLQQVANKNINNRQNNIVDRINILRHSGSLARDKSPDQTNSKLLNAVKKSQMIREKSQTTWENKFAVSGRVSKQTTVYGHEGIRGKEHFQGNLVKDPSIQKIATSTSIADYPKYQSHVMNEKHRYTTEYGKQNQGVQFEYDPEFIEQFKDRYRRQAHKQANLLHQHSKSAFNAMKAPVAQKNDILRDSGSINVKSIYEAKKISKADNRTDQATNRQEQFQKPSEMMRSSHDQQIYMSDQYTIRSGEGKPEDTKKLTAAEQVMLTRPIDEESLSNSKINIVNRGFQQDPGQHSLPHFQQRKIQVSLNKALGGSPEHAGSGLVLQNILTLDMNDQDRSSLRTKVAVKNQQRALSHLHLVNQGALNVPTLVGSQKNVNLPSIAKKNLRHQQQTPASQSVEARNQYWSGVSQNNISKSNLKNGNNHFSNYSQNLLSKESSTKMPKMSREKIGPVDISIDAIMLKDGKHLPALAKESRAYWRNSDQSLKQNGNKNESGPLYITRSRQNSESSARSKPVDEPYKSR